MKKAKVMLLVMALAAAFVSCRMEDSIDEDELIMDVDGNEYHTVKIGDQIWMAENLRVLHYRNGDPIPNVIGNTEWSNRTTAATCIYGNTTLNVNIYGRLYNWYAAADSRGIAPEGWHLPSNEEWQTLIDCLGGAAAAGAKLKAAGLYYWQDPNTGATNESGFYAQPGGYRDFDGVYIGMGFNASFATATESPGGLGAYFWECYHDSTAAYNGEGSKLRGFSVRCVKDDDEQ